MTVPSVRPSSLNRVLVALLPVLCTGCYTFVPSGLGEAPLTTNVRAHLSEPARQRLWAVVPPERRYLDGRLIRRDGDTLLVEVPIQGTEGAATFVQRIPLTRDEIVFLQIRHLDQFRTSLAAGLFVAAAASIVVKIFTGRAGGGAYPPVDDGLTESVISGLVLSDR